MTRSAASSAGLVSAIGPSSGSPTIEAPQLPSETREGSRRPNNVAFNEFVFLLDFAALPGFARPSRATLRVLRNPARPARTSGR